MYTPVVKRLPANAISEQQSEGRDLQYLFLDRQLDNSAVVNIRFQRSELNKSSLPKSFKYQVLSICFYPNSKDTLFGGTQRGDFGTLGHRLTYLT